MTYSLAWSGRRADYGFTPPAAGASQTQHAHVLISDANALPGGTSRALQLGTQVLCQLPDGSQRYMIIDDQLSTPANPVLRPAS